jgi:hypothetical protein
MPISYGNCTISAQTKRNVVKRSSNNTIIFLPKNEYSSNNTTKIEKVLFLKFKPVGV